MLPCLALPTGTERYVTPTVHVYMYIYIYVCVSTCNYALQYRWVVRTLLLAKLLHAQGYSQGAYPTNILCDQIKFASTPPPRNAIYPSLILGEMLVVRHAVRLQALAVSKEVEIVFAIDIWTLEFWCSTNSIIRKLTAFPSNTPSMKNQN